ncbi:MAG: TrkH family potassium uptake protein, partial [Phycisphaerae bacterium]|nr:TrkH family potassium uptake protein [Phycisphaerae bacterium]
PHRSGASIPDAWSQLSGSQRFRETIFQSISARTAGFNTIDIANLTNSGKLWLCGLMTIGGSPAGTAGGIKTVTFVLLILSGWCVLRRRNELEAFHRSIPETLLRKATTVVLLYIAMVFTITMILSVAMRNEQLIDILFEVNSACGTVGFSTGVTERLDAFGKILMTLGMLIGRVGPLTLVVALGASVKTENYTYPRENVLIG